MTSFSACDKIQRKSDGAVRDLKNCNYVFFEEFKRLDKLCSELYGGPHGVSSYIDRMKNTRAWEARCIGGWETDLHQLIHLRHMRNHLAHEGSFEETLSTQQDVEYLSVFYQRILRRNDPLALLEQERQRRRNEEKRRTAAAARPPVRRTKNKPAKLDCFRILAAICLWSAIAAALALLVLLMRGLMK